MTTEPEARELLTTLHHLATLLDTAILDSAMPAPSGSNAGCAPIGPKAKSPCSDTLGDQRRTYLGIIQPIAGNLGSDLNITGSPAPEVTDLAPWVWWLRRHRVDLIARPWWPGAEDEIRERVHRPLADQFTPPLSLRENLPTGVLPPRLTEQEMCDAFNVTPAAVRQWKHRRKIRDTGAVKRVLVKGEAEHHTLYERVDGTPWPTRKATA